MNHSQEVMELNRQLVDTMAEVDRAEAELAPGIYPGLDFDLYHRIPAASNTAMNYLRRSPAHLKSYLDEPPKVTDPQDWGSALHTLVLEPIAFEDRYRQGPCDNRALKAWKEFAAGLEPGTTALRPSDWKGIHRAAEQILAHPACRVALEALTEVELSGVWIDEATGQKCKFRPDGIAPSIGAVIDVKTTRDASEREFSRAIGRYSYYRQGAFYRAGLSTLLPETEWRHHIIIAVEKEPPYAVQAFRLQDRTLQAGHDEIFGTPTHRGLLARYAECAASDCWPAYSERFVEIDLPSWHWKELESEVYE